jgi:hypothetical protein
MHLEEEKMGNWFKVSYLTSCTFLFFNLFKYRIIPRSFQSIQVRDYTKMKKEMVFQVGSMHVIPFFFSIFVGEIQTLEFHGMSVE